MPAAAKAGDRIVVEGAGAGEPDEQLNPKKKVWEKLQADLKTNASGEAVWNGQFLVTPAEQRLTSKLANCAIK